MTSTFCTLRVFIKSLIQYFITYIQFRPRKKSYKLFLVTHNYSNFAIKLDHFIANTFCQHETNTEAYQQE